MIDDERLERLVTIGELILTKLEALAPESDAEGGLLNTTEAAKYIGISTPTVRAYTERGLLHKISKGGFEGFEIRELKKIKLWKEEKKRAKQS